VGVDGSDLGWIIRHRGRPDLQLSGPDQARPYVQHSAGARHQRLCSREDGRDDEGTAAGKRRRGQGLPGVTRRLPKSAVVWSS